MSQRSSSNLITVHIITKSNLLCGRNNDFSGTSAPAGAGRNLAVVWSDRRKTTGEKQVIIPVGKQQR